MTADRGADGARDPIAIAVAGWYPSSDEVAAGRFVADQVSALAATGRVRPWMIAWENVPVQGDAALREAAEAAMAAQLPPTIAQNADLFAPEGAHGSPGVPLARLGIAVGEVPSVGPLHLLRHREMSILALAQRPEAAAWRLVHGHTGYPEGAAAAALARRLQLPFVLTEHATFVGRQLGDPAIRGAYGHMLETAARVLPVSRMLGSEIAEAFPEHAHRIVVIPNTVAVDGFGVAGPAERRPEELLWVGYRKEIKGIDTLLLAFRIVRAARPGATLRLIGRSPTDAEEAHWKRLAADLGVADAVAFEAQLDRAGVAEAMQRAGVFVHASTRETFGMVAAEALATGLPVVATDSGGVTEVLGDRPEDLGALVPARDPDALAAAVLATIDRRASFDPLALRRHVVDRYGAASVAERIVGVYEDVLAAATPASQGASGASGDGGSPAIPAPDPARPVVILAGQRRLLDNGLRAHPAWVTADAWIVTSGPADPNRPHFAVAPPGADRRIVELTRWGYALAAQSGLLGLAVRLVTAPFRLARRRFGRRALEARVLAEMRELLDQVLGDLPPGSGRPLVIALGGIDHLVVRPFVEAGRVEVAPGALRWLGDRRWAGEGRDRSARA